MRTKQGAASGFTLIELMTVVLVFSVLAAVAVPAINTWLPGYRLRSSARQFGSMFQMARLKSATNASEYRVGINPTLSPVSIQVERGNAPTNSTAWVCETGNYAEMHDSIVISSVTPATAAEPNLAVCRPDGSSPVTAGFVVIFRPNGSTTAGAELVVLMSNAQGDQYRVRVANTTGRVRVDKL